MSSKHAFLCIPLVALTLCASAAPQHPPRTHPPHRILRALHATPEQRAIAKEEARAAGPIARGARADAAKIRADALRAHPGDREAAREEMRGKLKELRERTFTELRPLAQRVISTLTPEQRAKLVEAAKRRGRTLDEARLEKLTALWLARKGVR